MHILHLLLLREAGPPMFLPFAVGAFVVAAYLILGSFFDWDFLLDNRSARKTTLLIGRKGARVLFAMLGFVSLAFAIVWTLAILSAGR